MTPLLRVAAFATAVASMCAPSFAQVLVWDVVAPTPFTAAGSDNLFFGRHVYETKDVDADGYDELLVSSNLASPNGVIAAGWVGLLSGFDGHVIRSWSGTTQQQFLFSCGTVGDADGDGAGDVGLQNETAAGVPYYAYYSGATGAQLNLWYAGGPLCAQNERFGGDRDGDGIEEFLALGTGVFQLLEGPTAVPQWTVVPADPYMNVNWDIQSIDDFDGDGVRDVLIGGPGTKCLSNYNPAWFRIGRMRVYSGLNGALLTEYLGDSLCDYFGHGVAAIGDVNGDGVQDFVGTQHGLSQVKTISGANGATIAVSPMGTFPVTQSGDPKVTEVGDVDGDGSGDFAIQVFGAASAPVWVPTWVEIRRGIDHALLMTFPALWVSWPGGTPFQVSAGASLTDCGDEDGDGFVELAVGYAGSFYNVSGHIRRYSLRPVGVEPFGQGCPTENLPAPRICATGSLKIGQTFATTLSRAAPGSFAALAVGFSNTTLAGAPLPASLAPVGLPDCSLLVSPDLVLAMPTVLQPNQMNGASAAMVVPAVPALVGTTIYAQWAALDPSDGSIGLTRGLAATFQP